MSVRSLRLGLRRLFCKDRVERELTDEITHYVEMSAGEYMRQGYSRDEAERKARASVGGVESLKETVRSAGWDATVDTILKDLRYSARALQRQPTFTLAAALTLALGIGATTAMFSVVNGVLLRPLPYADAGRLVLLWTDDVKRGLHRELTAYATIADWQRDNRTFDGIAFFSGQRAIIPGERSRIETAFASANLLPLLGVPPALGRWLSPDDVQRAAPVAVISHALWQRRFGADPDVLGKSLVFDEWQGKGLVNQLAVVGVMPPEFTFFDRQTEVWVPATLYWRWTRESSERFPSSARRWVAVGRLKSSASLAEARADFTAIAARLTTTYGTGVPDFSGFTVNLVPMLDYIAGPSLQVALWLLMGAVGLVLLVACANVGNLLLARGAARQHELAIRRALGASRPRLLRQLVTESLILTVVGGAWGVALALAATRALSVIAVDRLPRLDEVTIDGSVLAFAVITSVLAAAMFALLPAWRSTEGDTAGQLRDAAGMGGAPRVRRTRGLLVAVECSLAVVLLVGAGLLLRSLVHVYSVDTGFDASNVLVVRVELPRAEAPAGTKDFGQSAASAREQTVSELIGRLTSLPDVESAGFVDDLWVSGQGNESITFPGRDVSETTGELAEAAATPGFFPTLRVRLQRGRYLTREDAQTKIRALWTPLDAGLPLADKARQAIAEPVVVNDAFVQRFLPDADPIGERFCVDPTNKTYCYEIVGVIANLRRSGPERPSIPEYYGSFTPFNAGRGDLLIRTRGNPAAIAGVVRTIITDVLPGALVPRVATASADLGAFSAQRSLQTWLLVLFAGVALLLAAIGIYGIVHYAVAQRTREIAVRIALGASRRDVLAMIVGGGMRIPIAGLAVGLLVSIATARLLGTIVFEVGTTDPITFVAVGATLLIAALVACYAPARRAARMEAIAALRLE
jgi:putative ABC transport system permease protein